MNRISLRVGLAAPLCAAGIALGQGYSTGFEAPTFTGSAAGTIITGTDGWYLPAVASSSDGFVFTHAGNIPGIAAHPSGGDQFEGGVAGNAVFIRAQRDVSLAAGGVWQIEYDVAVKWMGALPAADYAGSWSLQPSSASQYFQTIVTWGSVLNIGPAPVATNYAATADHWHQGIGFFTAAAPTAAIPTFETPSPAWRDLLVNNWYRVRVKWDFGAHKILECGIQDLTAGGAMATTDVSANNWYLFGGPTPATPVPTAMRLFSGPAFAGVPTSMVAFDNVSIAPVVVPCYPDCNGVGGLTIADFGCFQTKFVAGDPYADCNGVGGLTIADFGCFQTKFVAGCP